MFSEHPPNTHTYEIGRHANHLNATNILLHLSVISDLNTLCASQCRMCIRILIL